jgi:hypothetical protein
MKASDQIKELELSGIPCVKKGLVKFVCNKNSSGWVKVKFENQDSPPTYEVWPESLAAEEKYISNNYCTQCQEPRYLDQQFTEVYVGPVKYTLCSHKGMYESAFLTDFKPSPIKRDCVINYIYKDNKFLATGFSEDLERTRQKLKYARIFI